MLSITGKIQMIQVSEVINPKTNDKFQKVFLVIVKQMKGIKRNICFESFGKVSKEILKYRNGDRIRVYFTIDSKFIKGQCYHTIKALDVEKEIKIKKENYNNQLNFIDYDTAEKSSE
jgi:hypothetical protein